MAQRQPDADRPPPGPRLYLVAVAGDQADGLMKALTAMHGDADVAAVLLRLPERDDDSLIAMVDAIAPIVQQKGTALLLDGRPDLVLRTAADGEHFAGAEALQAGLPNLKPDRIVGAGALPSRHDAMLAAEAGADYVMFGEPDGRGHRPGLDAITERIAWWSDVFQPPCVGYAASLEEVAVLARAGADFVAIGDFVWNDVRGPAHALEQAGAQLRSLELT